MAPMAAGPAPVRNACALALARSRSKCEPPASTNTNDGVKATSDGQQPAAHPGGGVADHGHGLHHRARA